MDTPGAGRRRGRNACSPPLLAGYFGLLKAACAPCGGLSRSSHPGRSSQRQKPAPGWVDPVAEELTYVSTQHFAESWAIKTEPADPEEPDPDPEERPPVIINNGSVELQLWPKHGAGQGNWRLHPQDTAEKKKWLIDHGNPKPVVLQVDEAKPKGQKTYACVHAQIPDKMFPLPLSGQSLTLAFKGEDGPESVTMAIDAGELVTTFSIKPDYDTKTQILKRKSIDRTSWTLSVGQYTCTFQPKGNGKVESLHVYQLK